MTVGEAGKRGGDRNAELHSREHFAAIGRIGGAANKEKHGHEHFVELGRKGGTQKGKNAAERSAAGGL